MDTVLNWCAGICLVIFTIFLFIFFIKVVINTRERVIDKIYNKYYDRILKQFGSVLKTNACYFRQGFPIHELIKLLGQQLQDGATYDMREIRDKISRLPSLDECDDDFDTCESCGKRFEFIHETCGVDDDSNYFCSECWPELKKSMQKEHEELKKKGEL